MGYKYSPADAKMSAFMQKIEQTEKSPSKQLSDRQAKKKYGKGVIDAAKCGIGGCKKPGSSTDVKTRESKSASDKPIVKSESKRFFDTTPGVDVEVSAFDREGKIGPTVSSKDKTTKEFSKAMRKDYEGSGDMKKRAPKYQVEPETKEVRYDRTQTKFGKKDNFGLRDEKMQIRTSETKKIGGDLTDLSIKKDRRLDKDKYKSYTTSADKAKGTSSKVVSQKKIDRKLKQAKRQLGRGTGKKLY